VVVEEAEREHDATLAIHSHEAAVTHAIDDSLQALLELLLAGGARSFSISRLGDAPILLARRLRLLLKTMQDVHGLLKPGDRHHPEGTARLPNSDFPLAAELHRENPASPCRKSLPSESPFLRP
jgi:predicted ATPase